MRRQWNCNCREAGQGRGDGQRGITKHRGGRRLQQAGSTGQGGGDSRTGHKQAWEESLARGQWICDCRESGQAGVMIEGDTKGARWLGERTTDSARRSARGRQSGMMWVSTGCD